MADNVQCSAGGKGAVRDTGIGYPNNDKGIAAKRGIEFWPVFRSNFEGSYYKTMESRLCNLWSIEPVYSQQVKVLYPPALCSLCFILLTYRHCREKMVV
jgi:hypothetical protein